MEEQVRALKKDIEPLQGKLERLRQYLEQREKEHLIGLEDLGRGFAHRVRNYLGIMSGTLQLCLANYKMEPELQEQVNLVDQNAQEMLKAIEEFLSLVRVPEMNLESVDVNQFLQRTLAALEDRAKSANVRFMWTLAEGLPPASADPRLLAEAFSSLAVNAIDAMPDGGKLIVETSHVPEDRLVKVVMRDSGKGINDNHVRKVFQPYFSTRKGYKGLGLTVCKRIMELHRGSIAIESVKGEGTTVTLHLPAPEAGPARSAGSEGPSEKV
jgi:signal transduction histidine kinase